MYKQEINKIIQELGIKNKFAASIMGISPNIFNVKNCDKSQHKFNKDNFNKLNQYYNAVKKGLKTLNK